MDVLQQLPGGPQAAVHPLIAGRAGQPGGDNLPFDGLQPLPGVEAAQIHIPFHRSRAGGLHHVRGGAIHNCYSQLWKNHSVQGVGVTGAGNFDHLVSGGLGVASHPAHERGFSAPRPAL